MPTIPIKNNEIIEVPLIKLKWNGTLTKLYQMVKILLICIITLEHYWYSEISCICISCPFFLAMSHAKAGCFHFLENCLKYCKFIQIKGNLSFMKSGLFHSKHFKKIPRKNPLKKPTLPTFSYTNWMFFCSLKISDVDYYKNSKWCEHFDFDISSGFDGILLIMWLMVPQ